MPLNKETKPDYNNHNNKNGWVVCWVLWPINLCRLFNVKSILNVNNQFYFKHFSLAWVHILILKNISISNNSVYNKSDNDSYPNKRIMIILILAVKIL